MLARVLSGAVLGIGAYIVKVEVNIDKGIPSFSMVGLLGNVVNESRERVEALQFHKLLHC